MVFWLSVLVFIAGIMTYMFFPRSDQYQLSIYQEEGNVVTFVNQHQAAKDLMYQMISWNPETNEGVYILPYGDVPGEGYLSATKAEPMTGEDVNDASLDLSGVGNFASAMVCLTNCDGGANCVKGKMLTQCPSGEQYIITYGYFPNWWNNKTFRHQAWYRSLLKRTHGSVACGLLADLGEHEHMRLYSINNSQRFSGYQVVVGKRVVPPALTAYMIDQLHINTCDPPGSSCENPLNDLMFCMTAFQNPYRGTPVFHWDSINNNKTAHDKDRPLQSALVGTFQNTDEIIPTGGLRPDNKLLADSSPYTMAGVMKEATGIKTLMQLNGSSSTSITQTCNSTDCTLSVTGGPSVTAIPLNKGFSFTYTVTNEPKQTLTVYYNQYFDPDGNPIKVPDYDLDGKLVTVPEGARKEIRKLTATTDTAGPTLYQTRISTDAGAPNVSDLRLYNGAMSDKDALYNAKADLKRFGL